MLCIRIDELPALSTRFTHHRQTIIDSDRRQVIIDCSWHNRSTVL